MLVLRMNLSALSELVVAAILKFQISTSKLLANRIMSKNGEKKNAFPTVGVFELIIGNTVEII